MGIIKLKNWYHADISDLVFEFYADIIIVYNNLSVIIKKT